MRISDWSSDVCSSDLIGATSVVIDQIASATPFFAGGNSDSSRACEPGIIGPDTAPCSTRNAISDGRLQATPHRNDANVNSSTEITNTRTTPKRCISQPRSEEHTSELQSLMRISYAVLCLKKQKNT